MSRIVCVEVQWRDQVDGRVSDLLAQIHQLGLSTITGGHISKLYYLRGRRGKSARITERQDHVAAETQEAAAK